MPFKLWKPKKHKRVIDIPTSKMKFENDVSIGEWATFLRIVLN